MVSKTRELTSIIENLDAAEAPFVTQLSRDALQLCNSIFLEVCDTLDFKSPMRFILEQISSDESATIEEFKSDDLVTAIKTIVHRYGEDSHIDYRQAKAFIGYDKAYFYKNLYKCLLACGHMYDQLPLIYRYNQIADLGSGSGTFTIAWLLFRRALVQANAGPASTSTCRILLVDKHDLQLAVASQMCKIFGIYDATTMKCDLFSDYPRVSAQYLRISSYLYCSYVGSFRELPKSQVASLLGECAIIIDYERVERRLESLARQRYYNTYRVRVTSRVREELSEIIKSNTVGANILVAISQ